MKAILNRKLANSSPTEQSSEGVFLASFDKYIFFLFFLFTFSSKPQSIFGLCQPNGPSSDLLESLADEDVSQPLPQIPAYAVLVFRLTIGVLPFQILVLVVVNPLVYVIPDNVHILIKYAHHKLNIRLEILASHDEHII